MLILNPNISFEDVLEKNKRVFDVLLDCGPPA